MKKGIISLVSLVLLVVIIIGVSIKLFVTEDKIISTVTPYIEKTLDREVTIKHAKAKIFPFIGVQIDSLSISNTQRDGYKQDDNFIAFNRFNIEIALIPLIQKKLIIKEISLDGGDILVEHHKDDSWNYDDLAVLATDSTKVPKEKKKKENSNGELLPIVIKKIALTKSRVRYFDYKDGYSLELNKIEDRTDFKANSTLTQLSTTGELTVSDIKITSGLLPTSLKGITITFNHNIDINQENKTVTINDISASLQKIAIQLKGSITDFDTDANLDLTLASGKINFSDIINELKPLSPEVAKIATKGYSQMSIKIGGNSTSPKINGAILVKDGELRYSDFPESFNTINGDITFTENSLNIKHIGLHLGKNPISFNALVENFSKPNLDAELKAKLNLDDMRNLLSLPAGFTVGGIIDAGLTAKGLVDAKHPEALNLTGSVKVSNLKAKTVDLSKPILVDGNITFSAQEILENVLIKIADSDISIKSSLKNYLTFIFPKQGGDKTALTMDITSNSINTNNFLTKKEVAKDTTIQPTTPKEDNSNKPIMDSPFPPIDVTIGAKVGTFQYDNIVLTNLNGSITLLDQIFKLAGTANMYGGTTKAGFSLDATNLKDLKIKTGFDANKVNIDKLISSFNNELDNEKQLNKELKKLDGTISGTATLTTLFKTRGVTNGDMSKNLLGKIHASVANGSINGGTITEAIGGVLSKFISLDTINFRTVNFNAHIADEKLYIDTLNLSSQKAGDWLAYGPIGFDNSLDLSVEVRLTKSVSAPIVAGQQKGKAAINNLADQFLGSNSAIVKNAVKSNGIPVDKDGRITPIIGIVGTVSKPKPTLKGFKKCDNCNSSTTESKESIKQEVTQKINKAIDDTQKKIAEEKKRIEEQAKKEAAKKKAELEVQKKKAQEEADRKKKAAEAKAKKEAEEAKKKAEAAKKKAEEEAKKATNSAKKTLKKFGF